MNDQQHAFWLAYIRQLADLLGLKDRDVVVERNPPNDVEALAYIWCHSDAVNAHIYLSRDFLNSLSPERQRCIIAHELMHIHTTPYDDQVRWMLDHLPKSDLTDALPALVRTEVERLTDRLAYIVAPFLPLPAKYVPSDGEIFRHEIRDAATGRPIYPVPVPTNGAVR